MSDDYLWDRTGQPDPDVQRLEALLGALRSSRPAPAVGEPGPRAASTRWGWGALAAAATVAVAVGAASVWIGTRGRGETWTLTWLDGASWAEARAVRQSRLGTGQWIETRTSRARLQVGGIGEVQLEPATTIGLVAVGHQVHRLSLVRGVMHALIWAPPGRFVVETPSAVAVDLGCRYTLEVEDDGSGVLRVEAGWVGFEHGGVRSLVPAGAVGDTRPGKGPGTPHYEDASAAFSAALDVIDFGGDADARRQALDAVLGEARPRDALSLWHLLSRLDGEARGRVHDRLAELVPPPAALTRRGILAGDRAMLDAWWDELDLGPAESWRPWTAPWSSSPAATTGR